MNQRSTKEEMLLLQMQHAIAWTSFTTAQANYDIHQFGHWRVDYDQQAAGFHEDYMKAGRELEAMAVTPRSQASAIMTDPTNPLYAKYQAGDADTVTLVNSLLMQA